MQANTRLIMCTVSTGCWVAGSQPVHVSHRLGQVIKTLVRRTGVYTFQVCGEVNVSNTFGDAAAHRMGLAIFRAG